MAPTLEFVDLVDGAASAVLGVLSPGRAATYLNFTQHPTDAGLLFMAAPDRLAAVKSAYDPTNPIRSHHPMGPGAI